MSHCKEGNYSVVETIKNTLKMVSLWLMFGNTLRPR